MFKGMNTQDIIAMYTDRLANSEDPIQRRDSLLLLNFIAKEVDDERGRVVGLAEKSLKGDADSNVRRHAAWVLKDLFADDSLKYLAEALGDESCDVRFEVVEALAKFSEDEDAEDIIPVLLIALGDSHPEVRFRALYHLSGFDGSDVCTEIVKLYPAWEDDFY